MDPEFTEASTCLVNCCDCGCACCAIMHRSLSGTMLRSVKRKIDESEKVDGKFVIPGLVLPQNARVGIENECIVLREMVTSQLQTIQDLSVELEEERNAASSAANEAMSMILRLQREKAEVQMEARQFKRFAEEKMAHDQQELLFIEDLCYKREQTIQSLTCEVQMYKHRMMSYGFSDVEADGSKSGNGMMSRNNSIADNLDGQFEPPKFDYPSLKCNIHENQVYSEVDDDAVDVQKYAFGETSHPRDHLKDLAYRINQMEQSPRNNLSEGEFFGTKNVLVKEIVGQSPRQPRHVRKLSNDSSNSNYGTGRESRPDFTTNSPNFSARLRKTDSLQSEDYSNIRKVDNALDVGDDMSDRVYTIDSIHLRSTSFQGITEPNASAGMAADYVETPRESGDPEIQKLYMRLQVLEADRESMRQALISMRTDKAQLVLLKEIAQHLCKEMSPVQRPPLRKPSLVRSFSFISVFRWVVSLVFWRKKARQCRYMLGFTGNDPGLRMILDKGPRVGQSRSLSSTQV